MRTPAFALFLGSVLQILVLALSGWREWQRTSESDRSVFIKRWSENVSLEIINKILLPLLLVPVAFLVGEKQNALFSTNEFQISFLRLFAAIVFIDFLFFCRHWLYHSLALRWHLLHHSGQGYDVSLTLRFHPVENLVNYLIFYSGILILQITPWELVFIIQLFAFQALWSHVSEPLEAPAVLNLGFWDRVLITPRSHRLHHGLGQDSGNYGFLFSFWDQIFGTFRSPTKVAIKESQ